MNQDFAEYVKDHIREYLPPEYQDADISIKKVTKSNDWMLTGLTIFQPGEQVAMTIYLEPFAEQTEKGRTLDSIMQQIAEIQTNSKEQFPMDVSMLYNYKTVRPMLSIQLCDPETRREYLKDKPYTPCGDLAAFYRIQIAEDNEGTASAAVTEKLMQIWGISKDQLHKDAVQSESIRNPVRLYDMEDLIFKPMFSTRPDNLFTRKEPLNIGLMPLYALTNQNQVNGAGVLAQDGVLERVGGLIGSNFYVLPSSIHEVIIVPDNRNIRLSEMEAMVREINTTQVAPNERLSDKVQYYDREAKILGCRQEKSVLEQLADKKTQVLQAEAMPKTKQTKRNELDL